MYSYIIFMPDGTKNLMKFIDESTNIVSYSDISRVTSHVRYGFLNHRRIG